MDSQKNDLYKTKLRGDEIYALVYIFSDIYGGLRVYNRYLFASTV